METRNKVIEVINSLADQLGIAIDWTSKNVTPYLQDLLARYINYRLAFCIMCIVLSILLIMSFLVIRIPINYGKKILEEDKYSDWEAGITSLRVLYCVLLILGIWLLFCSINNMLMCIYFPEGQMIRYLNNCL